MISARKPSSGTQHRGDIEKERGDKAADFAAAGIALDTEAHRAPFMIAETEQERSLERRRMDRTPNFGDVD
jgi:hypothetical protein